MRTIDRFALNLFVRHARRRHRIAQRAYKVIKTMPLDAEENKRLMAAWHVAMSEVEQALTCARELMPKGLDHGKA